MSGMDVSSYDRQAPTPEVGSVWVWEPDIPHAREIVEVVDVTWNGEEWWVRSRAGATEYHAAGVFPNDLSRFYEACRPLTSELADLQ